MIYKHLVLLLLVAGLGACSNMSSNMSSKNATNTDTTEETQNTAKPAATEQELKAPLEKTEVALPSQDDLLVQSLLAQSDSYLLSKRVLTPFVKTKVVKALSEFNNGEFEQSEKSITQVLRTELNLTSAVYVIAGDIALANDKQLEAIANYKSALKLNSQNAKAANRLAMQLREQGDFVGAQKLYSQAIKAQPSQAESYRNRAVLYDLYLDEKAQALQDYKTYSALLKYSLKVHENSQTNTSGHSENPISEKQMKLLKTNIKLVKIWLADVGRQVATLAKLEANNSAGGQ